MKSYITGFSWFLLFSLALHHTAISADTNETPPNILLISADNLGYGDLQCYNAKSALLSPNLNRLASEGARLTDFYTASPTCTVSRACLLTGRVAQRHGLLNQLPGLEGNYGVGLRQSETLLPQILRQAPVSYATGCFGKWNIGFAKGSRPTERGFDEFVGHASGNIDYYHHQYNGRHDLYRGTEELHVDGTYSTDLFADAAIDFIQRHSRQQKPWFCYLPFNAPHSPNKKNKRPNQPNIWQAPDWAFQKYGLQPDEEDPRKRYEAVVTALDAAIGRVLKSLDDARVADNTFVFFMSDNGAFRLNRQGDDGINTPLRHGGVTCWEGGLRVVAMARWPGHIQPDTVVSRPLWSPDILPTCVAIANATAPDQRVLDGRDIRASLTEDAPSPHQSFYFSFRTHSGLRMGDWKIVREKPKEAWQLFNLNDDVSESTNLAAAHPSKLEELTNEFQRWEQQFP